MTAYAELQAASNFSFLRGAAHPDELVARAKELGLTALALTDHNSLAGVVRAHSAAKEAGLKFITGARLTPEDGPELLAYPTDRAAYGRLARLLTTGQLRAEKGDCRLFLDDIAVASEGLILIALPPDDFEDDSFVGVLSRLKAQLLEPSQPRSARHRPAPPPDHRMGVSLGGRVGERAGDAGEKTAPLYLAACALYRGDDRRRIARLDAVAMQAGTPLVATNDVLYHDPARRSLQDVVTCIREGCRLTEAGFRLEANAERHLKSGPEMARLFAGFEHALARTVEIAAACRFSLDELRYNYPDEPVPPGKTPQTHLESLTWTGARARYPDGVPDKVADALRKELALIAELDYAPYFLTVHDIVHWARAQGILCQGRGSAANSAVCYCLFITSVDPTEIDLLFERFLSAERGEPPDIDVDFEHARREEVMQYIYARYGRDRAGIAATVITYRSRSAIREVGKVLGLTEDVQAALAGTVWGWSDGTIPDKHIREAGLDPADPTLSLAARLASELIGFPRHLSQHVGGFVLTQDPLCEVVPIGNAAMDERTFVEWDKDDLDALGILKIDVLALGMLTCIAKCFALLKDHWGEERDLASFFPANDDATYDMLCRADSLGVFQVESRAQMNMLPRLKPRNFYDIVIEVAIVRPGPIQGDMVHPYLRRRDGLEKEEYPAPDPAHGPPDELARILAKTKGVPIFQEQAMKIAIEAAKFTPDEANELRHAMATFRRRGTIERLEEKMVGRMIARGYDAEFARRCFNQIKGFGEYGFPESHSASFSLLVYVSAWLKCHRPAVFACALLNAQPMGFYAPAQIVRDGREHGVQFRPVDVNFSARDNILEPCAASTGGFAVRLGFRQVKGLSKEAADAIVAARSKTPFTPSSHCHPGQAAARRDPGSMPAPDAGFDMDPGSPLRSVRDDEREEPVRDDRGEEQVRDERSGWGKEHPFTSIEEVQAQSEVPVRALEKLAAADGFRSLGLDRRQALWQVKALPKAAALPLFAAAETRETGAEAPLALPTMPLSEHVVDDYRTLRLSLKAHPVSFLRPDLDRQGILPAAGLAGLEDGARTTVAGLVLVRQRPGTASGVVFMTLEDETGIANAVVWPKTFAAYRRQVMGSRLALISGRIQRTQDIIHLVAQHMDDISDELLRLSEEGASFEPAIEAFQPAPTDRPGPTRPLRRGKDGKDARLPRFNPRTHPRDLRGLVPRSRDFH